MALLFTHNRRPLWALMATTLVAALTFATPASAAPDPVRTGLVRLKLSAAFEKQLERNRVSMKPKLFEVVGGTVDPATGTGSLKLGGRLRFERGDTEVAFKKARLSLGTGGALKAGRVKLFRVARGPAIRNGFGTDFRSLGLTLLGAGARKLNRELGLHSLHRGKAGAFTVSLQPLTLGVKSGTASLKPGVGPGSVTSKLAAHCVDPGTGMSAISPATQPDGPNTTIFFPITSGNLSPIGMAGLVSQGGGIQLDNGGSGLPAGCPLSNDVTIRIVDLQGDLDDRSVTSTALVSGPGSPVSSLGEVGSETDLPIDITDTWFNPDPVNLAIESNGSTISIDALSASMLNFVLPQPPPADPGMEFMAGDLFGTIGISARLR